MIEQLIQKAGALIDALILAVVEARAEKPAEELKQLVAEAYQQGRQDAAKIWRKTADELPKEGEEILGLSQDTPDLIWRQRSFRVEDRPEHVLKSIRPGWFRAEFRVTVKLTLHGNFVVAMQRSDMKGGQS